MNEARFVISWAKKSENMQMLQNIKTLDFFAVRVTSNKAFHILQAEETYEWIKKSKELSCGFKTIKMSLMYWISHMGTQIFGMICHQETNDNQGELPSKFTLINLLPLWIKHST